MRTEILTSLSMGLEPKATRSHLQRWRPGSGSPDDETRRSRIFDIRCRGMDGRELLRRVRQLFRHAVIFLTRRTRNRRTVSPEDGCRSITLQSRSRSAREMRRSVTVKVTDPSVARVRTIRRACRVLERAQASPRSWQCHTATGRRP
jgi:CheY-like chemotaxis protein